MFSKGDKKRGEIFFNSKVVVEAQFLFFMLGALTQKSKHAKSQSAATFCKRVMLNYTTIDPHTTSLMLDVLANQQTRCSRGCSPNTFVTD